MKYWSLKVKLHLVITHTLLLRTKEIKRNLISPIKINENGELQPLSTQL